MNQVYLKKRMSVEFVRDLGQPMPNIIPKINKIDTKNLVLLQAKFNQISNNAESTLKFCDEIYNIMHPNNKKFNIRGPSSRRRRNEFGRLYRRSRCIIRNCYYYLNR